MIVCDADNLRDYPTQPTPETIQEELRRQNQALRDLRRRLCQTVLPKAAVVLPAAT